MCHATPIRASEVTLGFAITTCVLAVTAAVVTAVAFFVLLAPPAIVIGGISATAALTVAFITLFVIRCLMQKRAASTVAPAISSDSIGPIKLPSLPVDNLRVNSLPIAPSSVQKKSFKLDTQPTSSSSSEESEPPLIHPLSTHTDPIVQTGSSTRQMAAACLSTQQAVVDTWTSKWKDDYVAHAIWRGNFDSIIQDGAVLPAEATLRNKGSVEREAGVFGIRIVEVLPALTADDMMSLEVLDPEDELELEKLLIQQKDDPFTDKDRQQLNELKKTILISAKKLYFSDTAFDSVTDDEIECHVFKFEIFKRLNIEIEDCLTNQSFKLYQELINKRGVEKDIKRIQRKKQGIRSDSTFNYARNNQMQRLAQVYSSKVHLIQIAYDQQKKGLIGQYYARKLQKQATKKLGNNALLKVTNSIYDCYRNSLCMGGLSLISEIRTLKNKVCWNYGNIAVLRGNSQGVVSKMSVSGETLMLHPIENNGQFFSLPLAHPETLIIGSYQHLSPFSNQLDSLGAKYVYIENLTEDQKEIFSIPEGH